MADSGIFKEGERPARPDQADEPPEDGSTDMGRERVVGQAADHGVVVPLQIHIQNRAFMKGASGTPFAKDMGPEVLTERRVQFHDIKMIPLTEGSDQFPGKDPCSWSDFQPASGLVPGTSRPSDGSGQRPG